MLLHYLLAIAAIYATSSTAVAAARPADADVTVRSWSPPGISSKDVVRSIRRSLSEYSHQKRSTVLQNSTTLERSWDGAVLLSFEPGVAIGNANVSGGVEITCTTCYLKTQASVQLTISESFNATQAFDELESEVRTAFENVTDTTISYVKDYVSGVSKKLEDGFDLDDFNLPPIDVDFNIDVPAIPECQLRFQFDEMDLYVALDTAFTAGITYTLNLYTSETPIGISIGSNLFLGVVVEVDLILSSETEINISSGFHIKLDDGAALEIPLFGDKISQTIL
ncbi:hypothetical protein ABW20_dc0108588 [Dactylellina cionopaga]|nr:hypothetical protein ABW20_dc0108588 [Dactylellina cionopaga]